MNLHDEYLIRGLRQRANAERNAYGVETALSRLLADAADRLHELTTPTVVDVDTGGRL